MSLLLAPPARYVADPHCRGNPSPQLQNGGGEADILLIPDETNLYKWSAVLQARARLALSASN